MDESFPLTCEFTSSVEAPDEFELTPGSLKVDNDSWFGIGDEAEELASFRMAERQRQRQSYRRYVEGSR